MLMNKENKMDEWRPFFQEFQDLKVLSFLVGLETGEYALKRSSEYKDNARSYFMKDYLHVLLNIQRGIYNPNKPFELYKAREEIRQLISSKEMPSGILEYDYFNSRYDYLDCKTVMSELLLLLKNNPIYQQPVALIAKQNENGYLSQFANQFPEDESVSRTRKNLGKPLSD